MDTCVMYGSAPLMSTWKDHNTAHWLCVCVCVCVCSVAQSCLTLCGPVDCSLADSSAHGIFQARILEQAAISYSIIGYTSVQNKKVNKKKSQTSKKRKEETYEIAQVLLILVLPESHTDTGVCTPRSEC